MPPTLYLEDFAAGDVLALGQTTLGREEIVAFARAFDPQPFHLDEEGGRQSIFGGLIASGWHTVSACMRLIADGLLNRTPSLGSPGVDEVRWRRPVHPGDTLTLRAEVLAVTPSRSKPDRGAVRLRYEAVNQQGEVVLSMTGVQLMGRRPEAA